MPAAGQQLCPRCVRAPNAALQNFHQRRPSQSHSHHQPTPWVFPAATGHSEPQHLLLGQWRHPATCRLPLHPHPGWTLKDPRAGGLISVTKPQRHKHLVLTWQLTLTPTFTGPPAPGSPGLPTVSPCRHFFCPTLALRP